MKKYMRFLVKEERFLEVVREVPGLMVELLKGLDSGAGMGMGGMGMGGVGYGDGGRTLG